MAASVVAGVAALALAAQPRPDSRSTAFVAAEVRGQTAGLAGQSYDRRTDQRRDGRWLVSTVTPQFSPALDSRATN